MNSIMTIAFAAWITYTILRCLLGSPLEMENFEPQRHVTDDEFVALMPEHDSETVLKVRSVLVDVSGWDRDEIHPDTRLIEFDLS